MADIGARLRASREAKRLSLDAVAASTRVQTRILSAIEQNEASVLPPRPYGRGFVRAYARELGLDADNIVREYFGQFAPPEPPPPERSRPVLEGQPLFGRMPLGAIAIAAAAILLLAGGWMVAHRESGLPAAPLDAVGTSGRASKPPPQPAPSPSPAVAPRIPAAAAGAGLTVVLNAAAPCWITGTADGKRVLYRALQPGERVSLEGKRTISIRAGNAGALTWTVNGRTLGGFGSSGEVRTMRVTPEAVQLVQSSAQE